MPRFRFVLWGARPWSVQIGGAVDRTLSEYRLTGWAAGPLKYRRAGW